MSKSRSHFQNEILEIIKEHNGKPCPSNIQLSARVGIETRRVSDFLCIMIRNGQLIKHGTGIHRSFHVPATGERTLRQTDTTRDDVTGNPKWAPCDQEKTHILKASKLPDHVWYGPRDHNGNPIRPNPIRSNQNGV